MRRTIETFLSLIESNEFYEAHEALEAVWFPRRFEDDDEIKVMKGFINAAVSFELLRKDRLRQAKNVWKNYEKYRALIKNVEPNRRALYENTAKILENYQKKLFESKNIL